MRRVLSTLLAAAALLLFQSGRATANEVETAIQKASRGIYVGLYKEGVRNVGVIAFETQKDTAKGPIRLRSGRLPETAATTLENSLILFTMQVEKKKDKDFPPVGVTRGSLTAALRADKDASFSTPEDRVKLFAHSYPLAWGDKDVKVDALLAGKVVFAADDKTFKVKIYSFTKDKPAYKLLFESEAVPATAAVFQDAQRPFVVKARNFNAADSESTSTFELLDNAAKRGAFDDGKTEAKGGADAKGSAVSVVPKPDGPAGKLEFQILYNGQPVAIGNEGVEERVSPPPTGTPVEFRMKSPVRVAVILLVNGVNTANFDQKTSTVAFSKWVLDPGVEYAVTGFYDRSSKLIPFTSVAKSDSLDVNALANPDKLGVIELQVFEERGKDDVVVASGTGAAAKVDAANSVREVSTKGKTLDDLVDEITKPSTVTARDVILPDLKNAVQSSVETAKFEAKPTPQVSRVIRYLDSNPKTTSTKPLISE